VQSNWVHLALRPPMELLWQPRVIMMMEKLVEWSLAGETEVLGETCPSATLSTINPTFCDTMQTQAAAVGSQRLTAWVTAWSYMCNKYTWQKARYIHKRQTHLLVRENVTQAIWPQGFSWKKKKLGPWRDQGAWRQDELTGGNWPVVKQLWTLSLVSWKSVCEEKTRRFVWNGC
jgi:hypothetical protein